MYRPTRSFRSQLHTVQSTSCVPSLDVLSASLGAIVCYVAVPIKCSTPPQSVLPYVCLSVRPVSDFFEMGKAVKTFNLV